MSSLRLLRLPGHRLVKAILWSPARSAQQSLITCNSIRSLTVCLNRSISRSSSQHKSAALLACSAAQHQIRCASDKSSELPPGDPSKGGDADIYVAPGFGPRPPGPKTVEDFMNPDGDDKNWVSYGFDTFNKKKDQFDANYYYFLIVTVLGCGLMFLAYYYPDSYYLQNWATREGYLELERRERLGLPLIDPNYVDPAKIQLPSEEELKGMEIYY